MSTKSSSATPARQRYRALLGSSVIMAATFVVALAQTPASAREAQQDPTQAASHAQPSQPAHPEPTAQETHDTAAGSHDAAAPAAGHGAATEAHGGDEAHGESLSVTLARLANFAILAGCIYLLARRPVARYLASRGEQIRKDLVDAAALRQTATARLADIEARLAALPAELEQMRARSAHELESERARIRAVAEAERDRLVEQARREIVTQTRAARVSLRAHAADLAVGVAEQRLRSTLTSVEQSALVDRYTSQMRGVQ